jgi:hypothetical protein
VAVWITAETGVGPSIASGNQVCKPNCADLIGNFLVFEELLQNAAHIEKKDHLV